MGIEPRLCHGRKNCARFNFVYFDWTEISGYYVDTLGFG